jgi:predicted phosphoribosyltransferase
MFDSIKNRFQFKFKDRIAAANILAAGLIDTISKEDLNNNVITVLGIPRGGVIVADTVATKLKASNFDIVMPRKLRIPHNEETAFGAIMGDGTLYIDNRIVKDLDISEDHIEKEKDFQLQEIKRRSFLYGKMKLQLEPENNTNCERTTIIILVDDGAASGATVIAAARSIRETFNPNKLVIALPVAPKETINKLLKKEADQVVVVTTPSCLFFKSVGQYYQEFEPVSDEKVIEILKYRNV